SGLLFITFIQIVLCLFNDRGYQLFLSADQRLNPGVELLIFLRFSVFGHRAGDDERRTSLVNQNGVKLINDSKVMVTLYQLVGIGYHIVAQIVETKLVVGAIGNVGAVGFPPRL